MHEPSDSSLLWDAVRVMARMLKAAQSFTKIPWRDRRRAAKRRAYAIQFKRKRPKRIAHYRELIKIARAMLAHLDEAQAQLQSAQGRTAQQLQAALAVEHEAKMNKGAGDSLQVRAAVRTWAD